MQGPGGNLLFLRVRGSFEKEVGGTGPGLRLTTSDISADYSARQLNEQLQQMDSQLSCALEGAEGGCWQWDVPNNTMWFDTRAARITGWDSTALEINFDTLLTSVHADDLESINTAISGYLTGKNNRIDEQFRIKTDRGGWKWIRVRGRVTEKDGQERPTHLSGILFSVDREKRLQQALNQSRYWLHEIIDNLPACIAYVDREHRYRFNNRCYEKWFGIPPAKCAGKPVREIIGEQAYQHTLTHLKTVLSGRKVSFENIFIGRDMAKRITEVTYIPDFDRQGEVKGYIVLAVDISASRKVKQLKEVMAGMQEQSTALQEANIALKVLIDQQRSSREEIEHKVLAKLKKLVFPYLDLLKNPADEGNKSEYLALIRTHLESLSDSFIQKLANPVLGLTPREILVADLVRQGRSSKEIAGLLGLSVRTVESYRMQLRKKLRLNVKKENLRSYLQGTFSTE